MKLEIPGIHTPVQPGKILCIGRNYAAHAREMDSEVPSAPMVFLKPSTALTSSSSPIVIPEMSAEVHHEVELVVAIGKPGRFIDEAEAATHVCAYAVGLDLTARDIQATAKKKGHPWSVSKGFDTFAPVGEFSPVDAVDDLENLEIRLTINGETRQQGNTNQMIFSIPHLIAYCSKIFTLEAGDLIYTGTPEGVGPIASGDRLVARLTGAQDLSIVVA